MFQQCLGHIAQLFPLKTAEIEGKISWREDGDCDGETVFWELKDWPNGVSQLVSYEFDVSYVFGLRYQT